MMEKKTSVGIWIYSIAFLLLGLVALNQARRTYFIGASDAFMDF